MRTLFSLASMQRVHHELARAQRRKEPAEPLIAAQFGRRSAVIVSTEFFRVGYHRCDDPRTLMEELFSINGGKPGGHLQTIVPEWAS